MKVSPRQQQLLERVRTALDAHAGRFAQLASGARRFDRFLAAPASREDEELLTEPVLADLLEGLLEFPRDAYFPQLGRSGLKPDFTPIDLVAHSFVLDAKSSTQGLAAHESQIRRYIDQRRLAYGVLFNLRELRVFRRGQRGHDATLSFSLLPLWQVARGEALPGDEVRRLEAFFELFHHRQQTSEDKITLIRRAPRWADLETSGERLEIDVEYLVDRLRELSRRLAEDAAAHEDELARQLDLSPALERDLVHELRLLALDIAPGTRLADLPESTEGFRRGTDLPARAWRQYLLRVSQLALTRILLYRSWEDVGFVDERLYDGAFGVLYDRLGQSVQRVLREAFSAGHERYRWLYGSDNNYDWYRPSEDVLVDVLYGLVPVPLGKLDADVLGGLYESYVDEIDRDRLGQFYTPRSVVRFMLDRAGFSTAEGVFRLTGDRRLPRRVFDFATGSGGFVVEAARRIVDEVATGDARALDEGLAAIVRGIAGSEISPFPYYLTEVNVLLQVSRLLGALRSQDADPGSFVLGLVHADTLGLRRPPGQSIAGFDARLREDRAELVPDERFGLVPLDAAKQEAYRLMREESFDLVAGNPPYVSESNNKVLFDRLRSLPGWKGDYRGKSDYLYYFLALAAEKVAEGGRLCVVTPAGWMNAGNAGWLREKLASTLRLDELFLFGSHRLFAPERGRRGERRRAPTPTVESAILIATRAPAPASHRVLVVALEDEIAAARALSGNPEARVPDRDALLAEMVRRAAGRAGRARGIHVHRMAQRGLVHDEPWPIKHGKRDVAARVVAHLDRALTAEGAAVEPLLRRWSQTRGIETGADAYTKRIQKRLSEAVMRRLDEEGRQTGDPILELPAGTEHNAPWREHPDLLARSPESRGILYGAIDEADYTSLVWIGSGDAVPREVVDELEPWRPVLATRAEIARNPRRSWYETAWPRDKGQLRAPKVVALYRTDRGRFAVDETGDWQPSNKATICTAREAGLSVAYLGGLLNSELLDLWYAVRGKTPRDVWRNYEPKPMARIPYRHVTLPDGSLPRVEAIVEGDVEAAAAVAADLRADSRFAGEAAQALVALVRRLADNRRALLPHRCVARRLTAIVKDPWRTGPIELDRRAMIQGLPSSDTLSVRIDPALAPHFSTDGPLGRAELDRDRVRFRRARHTTAEVTGSPDRLALLAELVEGRDRLLPADLEAVLLPTDLSRFHREAQERTTAIGVLLDAGRVLVEQAERTVCRLYAVPEDLEEAVVAHAVARADRADDPLDE